MEMEMHLRWGDASLWFLQFCDIMFLTEKLCPLKLQKGGFIWTYKPLLDTALKLDVVSMVLLIS